MQHISRKNNSDNEYTTEVQFMGLDYIASSPTLYVYDHVSHSMYIQCMSWGNNIAHRIYIILFSHVRGMVTTLQYLQLVLLLKMLHSSKDIMMPVSMLIHEILYVL